MLPLSSVMTPTIVADIEARGLSKTWDRLAIVANCCKYAVRLDGEALSRNGYSPSLSVLAMCLLNGEIIDNRNNDVASALALTTSEFLGRYAFREFRAPVHDAQRLTFNKGCRLTGVELAAGGAASGHLWKLSPVINTARFEKELPWIREPYGRLTLEGRKCLQQLMLYLEDRNHDCLANKIGWYLDKDADSEQDFD